MHNVNFVYCICCFFKQRMHRMTYTPCMNLPHYLVYISMNSRFVLLVHAGYNVCTPKRKTTAEKDEHINPYL